MKMLRGFGSPGILRETHESAYNPSICVCVCKYILTEGIAKDLAGEEARSFFSRLSVRKHIYKRVTYIVVL